MTTKRSRMMRSASTGDAELANPPPRPPSATQEGWRQRRAPTITQPMDLSGDQPARPSIFRIPSPVGESSRGVEITFDRCYHCTIDIPQDGDVFMYSLRAFCSEECREKHICIDEAAKAEPEPQPQPNSNSKRGIVVSGIKRPNVSP